MFFGKSIQGAFPLAGGTAVLAVLIGLSLKLDGSPRIELAKAAVAGTSSDPGDGVAAASVRAVSTSGGPRRSHTDAETRLKAGTIPSTGLRVLSTSYVDYRNDEGTRRRQAGTLVGPMPFPGQQDGVAAACAPLGVACSFNVECDDNNKCTTDRCEIIFGTPLCSGKCLHDPIADNKAGGCDNGTFCDGQETCQGAICSIVTAPNALGQSCDTHASCGEVGTCNTGTHLCTAGNIGAACTTNEACNVVGRCSGAPHAGEVCDSDADCAPGTCTIKGFCAPGTCTNGIPALCCTDPDNPTVCAEAFPKCDAASQNAGVGCQTSSDCLGGFCQRCQPSCTNDADCADGRRCNGTESCLRTCVGGPAPGILCTIDANCAPGGLCLGQCQPGLNPCGAGARCSDRRCGTVAPFEECLYDSDCPAGETCADRPAPGYLCFLGRCCEPGANPAASLTCSYKTLAQCDATAGNALFYAMDGGEQLLTVPCGGQDPRVQTGFEAWECPKYTSGITQLTAATPPIYPVIIGPISDSEVPVPAPGGTGVALHAIGDDYTFFNATTCVGGTNNGNPCTLDSQCPGGRCGSFLAMDALRYVGYSISGGSSLSIDFYDAAGNFVEDVVTDSMATELGINVVIFTPPLTIPPSGWFVTHVASDFAPSMYYAMASTTAAGSAGGNDPDALWINQCVGFPNCTPAASVNNNFLKMCAGGPNANEACVTNADCPSSTCGAAPGMLAFELIGDKIPDPIGACCESTGRCVDGVVHWVCEAQGHTYLGDNQLCAGCNGGANNGGACRICVGGGPAGLCTSDAFCSPGTCEPNTARCRVCVGGTAPPGTPCTSVAQCAGAGASCPALGSTCSTGLVGQSCTTNSQCDLTGFCDLNTLTCSAGDVGSACTTNAQCNVAGTCVPVACQPIAACAQGACCKTDPLVCNATNSAACCTLEANEAACNAAGGDWQGFGTECDADSGYEPDKQHCCPIPQYADLRCMGGPNNLQSCSVDGDCRRCVGGLHNGETCTFTSDADGNPGGCLDEGHCIGLVCVGGTPPSPNVCTVDAECPDNSGVCRGRCVNRGTGGDNCEDALVQIITVPALGEEPKTITISGSNNSATTTEEEPDGCFGPMGNANGEPGWFEAFAISQCTRVRIDLCCSDPILQPAYTVLYADCPCGQPIFSAPDPYVFGQPDAGQGPPYCNDDNAWFTFPMLPAGTYFYPVYSALAGAHGNYQMHVTVEACPTAACCYQACSGGPNVGLHCDKNAPCPGGTCQGGTNNGAPCTKHADCDSNNCSVTCVSQCTEVAKSECDALLGYFLGPPNIIPVRPLCLGNPCETGSCCTGPGQCLDQNSDLPGVPDDDTPMTSALCDEFNGTFVGGVRCAGGTCVGGADDGESCNELTPGQCGGGTCVGSSTQLAQADPCPVCQIQGSGNCQAWDNSPQMSPSDPSAGSEHVWADDFILIAGGPLTDLCVWGTYVETDLTSATTDCGGPEDPGSQRADNFRVRIFEDDGGKPGGGNCTNAPFQRCFANSDCNTGGTCLPTPLGESTCTRTKAVVPGAASEADGFRMWAYQLSLDNPITGLQAGKCYWLEVTNNTSDAVFGEKCTWNWNNLTKTSTQGNFYSAAGSEVYGYDAASQRPWDLAWCLNLDVAPGGCASEPRACCACAGACTEETLKVCDDTMKHWDEGSATCPGAGCVAPANDHCVNAQEVAVGLYSVSTQCATTDGGNPVGGRADTAFQQDVWYFFRPSEDCLLRADGCTSGQHVFDSVIAIYHDAGDPTQCVCPLDRSTSDRTLIDASNDDCVVPGSETGGVVEVDALAGHCYTIRLAGVPGDHQAGRSAVEISCGPPICGDQRRNGAEQCDGLDNENCRSATPSTLCKVDCTCGAPNPCGDGGLDAGEECDPNRAPPGCGANSTCRQAGDPDQCTCSAFCGNGAVEDDEECDGADDDICPGRCEADCTCPPLVCQNGRLEESVGEECEFGLCVGGINDGQPCESDAFCLPGGGTCDEWADRFDCPTGECRTKNDPLGGCRCACGAVPPPNIVVWDPTSNPGPWPNTNPHATTRSLRFTVTGESGPSKPEAIKITMVDLQHPNPANLPAQPPLNFTTYDTRTNGTCVGGSIPGHHCDVNADCLGGGTCTGGLAACTADPACTNAAACTLPSNSCARWVGKLGTFLESQDSPGSGSYRAARLQCTPHYWDWKPEGLITVVGAEIAPSSEYSVQVYGASCMGAEDGCAAVSPAVTMYTRRYGDVWPRFNPPSTARQPDGSEILVLVCKLKNVTSAPPKAITQLQPNLVELNADVNVIDLVTAVDAFRGLRYPFSGPCPCPSTVTCGVTSCTSVTPCVTAYGAGSMCVKTCVGGANAGDPCIANTHCPGSTCGTGFCRDRCGRCTP